MNNHSLERISFLIIVAFLLAQIFYLRPPLSLLKPPEPYPALLLPAGEQLYYSYGNIHYSYYTLQAISKEGKHKKVSLNSLLDTVPPQYREKIIWHKFGLNKADKNKQSKDIQKGIKWLKKKLNKVTSLKKISHLKLNYWSVNKKINGSGKDSSLVETTVFPLD